MNIVVLCSRVSSQCVCLDDHLRNLGRLWVQRKGICRSTWFIIASDEEVSWRACSAEVLKDLAVLLRVWASHAKPDLHAAETLDICLRRGAEVSSKIRSCGIC